MSKKIYTPENITELQPNEVFVLGSNMNGYHAGGAARVAAAKFGAIMGQAEGLQGQSYAIPTLDKDMRKVDLDTLQQSLLRFCWFANENADKVFYLTKIGMGIAGFTLEEMLSIVKRVNIPSNVIIPQEFDVVFGCKGFDKDLKCRGMQYEVGKEYEMDGEIECCQRGFHACESPMEVWDHYDMLDSRFCEVEQSGVIDKEENSTKVCSSKIKIKAELKLADIIKLGVDWLIEKTSPGKLRKVENSSGDYAKIGSSGDYAKIGSSGNYAQIGSSGDYAKIGSSGDYAKIGSSGNDAQIGSSGNDTKIGSSGDDAQIGSSGDDAQIGSSGDYAQIGSSGDYAQIGSSGDYAQIGSSGNDAKIGSSGDDAKIGSSGYDAQIGSSGDYAKIGSSGNYAKIDSTGLDSVICCAGVNAKAKAKKGSWITLSEWKYDDKKHQHVPVCVKTEFVDGERIKEDTWYQLINGEFREV